MGEYLDNLLAIPTTEKKARSGIRNISDSKKCSHPYKITVLSEEEPSFVNTFRSENELIKKKSDSSEIFIKNTEIKSTKSKKTQFPFTSVKLKISLNRGKISILPNSSVECKDPKETNQSYIPDEQILLIKKEIESKDSQIEEMKKQIASLKSQVAKHKQTRSEDLDFIDSNSSTVLNTHNSIRNTELNISDYTANDNLWLYHMEKQSRYHSNRMSKKLPDIHKEKQRYKPSQPKKQSSRFSNLFK